LSLPLGLKDVKVQSAADPESMCHDRGIVVRRKQVADELTRKTSRHRLILRVMGLLQKFSWAFRRSQVNGACRSSETTHWYQHYAWFATLSLGTKRFF